MATATDAAAAAVVDICTHLQMLSINVQLYLQMIEFRICKFIKSERRKKKKHEYYIHPQWK